MKTMKIGSRESRLAVIQSELLKTFLEQQGVPAELVTMKTTGDLILDRSLDQIGGKGLFVKELDRALLDRRSDVSVHSCKDLPMEVPPELPILGFSKREDPRDVLVLPAGCSVRELDGGCSSPIAAFARVEDDRLQLRGLYYSEQSGGYLTGELSGPSSEAENVGIRLARELRQKLDGGNAL